MNKQYQINPIELITAEEEIKLVRQAQAGDEEALQKVCDCNRLLVSAMVRKYEGQGLTSDQLAKAGIVGLKQAAARYDVNHKWKFSSYAVWFVHHAILDAIENGIQNK
ncbi:MAG: hypothetical protein NC453_25025 [Muribaculum sp.]|nr:hypothetical protein [Muribaculum sp.]